MALTRRGFLIGLGTLAAPAIVRPEILMKLWVPKPDRIPYIGPDQGLIDLIAKLEEARSYVLERIVNPPLLAIGDGSFLPMSTEAERALFRYATNRLDMLGVPQQN